MSVIHTLRALFSNRIDTIESLGRDIPRIGRSYLGPRAIVLVNHPDLVAEVLIERAVDFTKSPLLTVISRPVFGNGLLTSEGDFHMHRRRLVAPAFAHQRVSKYGDVMKAHASSLADTWRDGQTLDVAAAMMRLTLGIVGRTLFDVDLFDVDLLTDADSIGRDVEIAQTHAMRQLRIPFRLPQGRARAALARLDRTVYGMIRDRRASGVDHGDLLSMLIASRDEETGQQLDDTAVRDETMTLFLAGHETTALALTWSWFLLGCNPRYFARLREEGAPFALRTLKEAMRLYPPAYLIARQAARATSIGGFAIRGGEIVLMAPWLLHRSPEYFEDPMRFDPDRFLPEREALIPRFAYFPFGGGRRVCIGNQFALMEGQIILETLGRRFETMPVSNREPKFQPLITLRPKGGLPMTLRAQMSTGIG